MKRAVPYVPYVRRRAHVVQVWLGRRGKGKTPRRPRLQTSSLHTSAVQNAVMGGDVGLMWCQGRDSETWERFFFSASGSEKLLAKW